LWTLDGGIFKRGVMARRPKPLALSFTTSAARLLMLSGRLADNGPMRGVPPTSRPSTGPLRGQGQAAQGRPRSVSASKTKLGSGATVSATPASGPSALHGQGGDGHDHDG
jgi:hypothetical protein